jgi:trimethylamine-N-oxide reductase cytochrome c-type subunit TorC
VRTGALWALMIATALLALPAAAQLMPDRFDLELSALTAATRPRAGMRLVAVARHELRAGATGQETIGTLLPGAEVAVLATTRTRLSVRLDGWQQDPGGRAVYARRGLRILSLALTPEAARQVKPGQGAADPATGTVWRAVRVTGWLDSGGLVAARDRLSRDLAELNTSACGSCHAAKPPASLTAYQWAGGISSSRHRTLLDADQMALLLHWLQMGASDKGF